MITEGVRSKRLLPNTSLRRGRKEAAWHSLHAHSLHDFIGVCVCVSQGPQCMCDVCIAMCASCN